MNSTVVFATGVLSLAAGAIGGYFYAKHQLTEKFEADLLEETDRLRKKYYDIGVDREDDVKARESELKEAQEYLNDLTTHIEKKYEIDDLYSEIKASVDPRDPNEGTRTSYHKLAGTYSEPVADSKKSEAVEEDSDEVEELLVTDEEVEPMEYAIPEDEYQPEPYFIPQHVFEDNEFNYEQTTMSYFVADEILLDDHDHVFDEEEYLFGDLLKTLTRTGEDVYFVRNNKIKMELEVVVIKSSFMEVDAKFKDS